jgi:hypothetical protein
MNSNSIKKTAAANAVKENAADFEERAVIE